METRKTKSLPGNKYLNLDLYGNVYDIYGNNVTDQYVKENKITYDFYNKEYTFDFKFLRLLTWFECGAIPNLIKEIDNIEFYKTTTNIVNRITKHIMFFKKPIYYDKEFRIIPGYPHYAINKRLEVLDIRRNKIIIPNDSNTLMYKLVRVYNPENCRIDGNPLHRLYCLAWLENDLKEIRHYINHIDGNKKNNNLSNLEWCTHDENVRHALDTKLINTEMPVKVRDRWTGEVKHFKSAEEVRMVLGIRTSSLRRYISDKQPWSLVFGKYEIKEETDTTPWFYEQEINKYFISGKAIIIYTVRHLKTGITYRFNRHNQIFKAFNLKSIKFYENNAAEIVNKLNRIYPDYAFSYEIMSLQGPYIVTNIQTKERIIVNSIKDAQNITSINRNRLRKDMVRKDRYIYNQKWKVYPANEEPNIKDSDFKLADTVIVYDVENLNTGHISRYNSLRAIDAILKIDKSTSRKVIDNDSKTYKRNPDGTITEYKIRPVYLLR